MPKILSREEIISARVEAHSKNVSQFLKVPQLEIVIKFSNKFNYYGYCESEDQVMGFNPNLVRIDKSTAYDWVCLHEVAHLYHDLGGGCFAQERHHHNKGWKKLMLDLNAPPITYFCYNKLRKYILSMDSKWRSYSFKKLANPKLKLIEFDSSKLLRDFPSLQNL